MNRTTSILYETDSGKPLIRLTQGHANIVAATCTADDLDELASACSVAAEELRANAWKAEATQ